MQSSPLEIRTTSFTSIGYGFSGRHYFKNGAPFTDDFFEAMEELRRDELPLEEREPFD